MIGPRRLDGEPSQQRVIQVGRLQPGDIGRDAEDRFQHRQRAAQEHRRHDAAADGRQALPAQRGPVDEREGIPLHIDEPEGKRQQPGRQTHKKTGSDEPAALAHLEGDEDGHEAADQSHDEVDRVVPAIHDRSPQTHENRRIKPLVLPQQHRANQRREGVGHDERLHIRCEMPPLCARPRIALVSARCASIDPKMRVSRELLAKEWG